MANGIAKISLERASHPVRGYDGLHDEAHSQGELLLASVAHLAAFAQYGPNDNSGHVLWWLPQATAIWPWANGFNAQQDPIEHLVKAGSLIAAEIDRIQRTRTEAKNG